MAQQVLVSCVIIFLNANEAFFIEAIESVFAQTYANWELLLVDDGSTDCSTQVALRYAEQHPDKVRYLEHEGHRNQGMSASRNLGIRYAKGNYIALLDADDLWLPQKLEQQVAILETKPDIAMVYSSTWMWYSWTGNPEDTKRDRGRGLGVKQDTVIKPPILINFFLQGKAETPGTCSVLIRREAIELVDGFEESFQGMYEDQAFFYKICLRFPVFIQSGYYDRYRQHPSSACYVAESQGQYHPLTQSLAHLNFLIWFEQYLDQQEVQNSDISQLLREALFPYRHPFLHFCLIVFKQFRQRTKNKLKAKVSYVIKKTI